MANVYIPESLYERVARKSNKPVRELVKELLEEWLEEEGGEKK